LPEEAVATSVIDIAVPVALVLLVGFIVKEPVVVLKLVKIAVS
jgi:hypothetical protein